MAAAASARNKKPAALTASANQEGILSRVSNSPILYRSKQAASDAGYVAKRLLWSTGKAAWYAGTTFLILVVPLIIEMDRDQQFTEFEMQQASLLGAPSPAMVGPSPPSK